MKLLTEAGMDMAPVSYTDCAVGIESDEVLLIVIVDSELADEALLNGESV